MNKLTTKKFTSLDFQLFIDENPSKEERELWAFTHRRIDKQYLTLYINKEGNHPFKIIYNDVVVGHFNVRNLKNKDTQISRAFIYKKYRGKIIKKKPLCYWLVKLAIERALEMYPNKNIFAIVYDLQNNSKSIFKNKGLRCFMLAGMEEYKREIINLQNIDGEIFERIWLIYNGQL